MKYVNIKMIQEVWVVTSIWLLVSGIFAGAAGFIDIVINTLVFFIILALPFGILTIPIAVISTMYLGVLVFGHFSFAALIAFSWIACVFTAYVQWYKFGFSKKISFSWNTFAVGTLVPFIFISISYVFMPVY